MMDFALKLMKFALKMMDFEFKMMIYKYKIPGVEKKLLEGLSAVCAISTFLSLFIIIRWLLSLIFSRFSIDLGLSLIWDRPGRPAHRRRS